MEDYVNFKYEKREDEAWVIMNRPTKLNTMTPEFWPEMQEIMADVEKDKNLKLAIISGEGDRAFCAGGDIESFAELGGIDGVRDYLDDCFKMFKSVETMAKPTIAAVNGYALGGGCELTLACDIVIASEKAQFGTPEATVGLMPGYGVVRGIDLISRHAMKYLVFTGEFIDAYEAKAMGLVNIVVPHEKLYDEVKRVADKIKGNAPLGLKVAKRILNRGIEYGYNYTTEATSLLQSTEDKFEGVEAFKARRKPDFKGR